jgi:hypothetical protein
VCNIHGAKAPQVQAAARRRLEQQAAERAVTTYGLPRDVEPAQALVEEVHRTAGHVAWLAEHVAGLKADQLVSPAMALYQAERAHLARVAKAAIDAGIAERHVRLAERLGGLVADLLRGVLDELGLTGEQWELAGMVVPRRLEMLAGGLQGEGGGSGDGVG